MDKQTRIEVRVTRGGKPVDPTDPAFVEAIEDILLGLGYSVLGREELHRMKAEMEKALMMGYGSDHLERMLKAVIGQIEMLDEAANAKPAEEK